MSRFVKRGSFILLIIILMSCQNNDSPKPMGYLRIDFPEKAYQTFTNKYPYSFEYPVYGRVVKDTARLAEPFWVNVDFPQFAGKIHISYKHVNKNLPQLIDDSRNLAYKHSIKADEIEEILYTYPEKKVYGVLYDIKGNTASSVQFFLTDSTTNFLRGSLYFATKPNKDSLAPVVKFFRKDVEHLIETFSWTK